MSVFVMVMWLGELLESMARTSLGAGWSKENGSRASFHVKQNLSRPNHQYVSRPHHPNQRMPFPVALLSSHLPLNSRLFSVVTKGEKMNMYIRNKKN